MADSDEYNTLGIVGIANLFVLLLIVLWRAYRCAVNFDPILEESGVLTKKMFFHGLLACSVCVDFPTYVSFIVAGDYQAQTYAFHRTQGMFLFVAFSMTIRDWSLFLIDIDEMEPLAWVVRRGWLFTINLLMTVISLWSCIELLVSNNLDNFVDSPIYSVGLFIQLCGAALLMLMLLHAGLKLSNRLQAVAQLDTTMERSFEKDSDDDSVEYYDDLSEGRSESQASVGGVSGGVAASSPTRVLSRAERDEFDSKGSASYKFGGAIGGQPQIIKSQDGMGFVEESLSYSQPYHLSQSQSLSQSRSRGIVPGENRHRGQLTAAYGEGMGQHNPDERRGRISSANKQSIGEDETKFADHFRTAIGRLNIVVGLSLLTTLCGLGYLLAGILEQDADDKDAYFGPPVVDFTFHFWVPLWGPVLAMLYLARSSSRLEHQRAQGREQENDDDDDSENNDCGKTNSKRKSLTMWQQVLTWVGMTNLEVLEDSHRTSEAMTSTESYNTPLLSDDVLTANKQLKQKRREKDSITTTPHIVSNTSAKVSDQRINKYVSSQPVVSQANTQIPPIHSPSLLADSDLSPDSAILDMSLGEKLTTMEDRFGASLKRPSDIDSGDRRSDQDGRNLADSLQGLSPSNISMSMNSSSPSSHPTSTDVSTEIDTKKIKDERKGKGKGKEKDKR